jgi:hypothetical protein
VLGNATLDLVLRVGARVALHHAHVLDEHAALVWEYAEYFALPPFVGPCNHLYGVTFSNR